MIELRARLRHCLVPERYPVETGSREAAVALALTDEVEPRLLLIRRSLALMLNPGEVAFPGGKAEAGDPDLFTTALREAEEEVALPRTRFDFCGSLSRRVTLGGLGVVGMVGVIPHDLALVPDPGEVTELICIPLSRFADRGALHVDRIWFNGESRLLARYQFDGRMIWGMTAGFIVELVNRLYDAGLPNEIYQQVIRA